jgi:hypothetical protein
MTPRSHLAAAEEGGSGVGCDGPLVGCLKLGCARVKQLAHGAGLGRRKRMHRAGLKEEKQG